jgi:hypothetical protein
MYKPVQTITKQELAKKQLELEENYKFKFEKEHNCYSFEIKKRKAFIINLSNQKNHNKIYPYFTHRNYLAKIVDDIFLETGEEVQSKTIDFLKLSMDIITNMLDSILMASTNAYVNFIIDLMKKNELTDTIELLGSIIAMIDIAVNNQLEKFTKEDINKIAEEQFYNDMLNNVGNLNIYMLDSDGKFKKIFEKGEVIKNTSDPNDLRNMKPLNKKAI